MYIPIKKNPSTDDTNTIALDKKHKDTIANLQGEGLSGVDKSVHFPLVVTDINIEIIESESVTP